MVFPPPPTCDKPSSYETSQEHIISTVFRPWTENICGCVYMASKEQNQQAQKSVNLWKIFLICYKVDSNPLPINFYSNRFFDNGRNQFSLTSSLWKTRSKSVCLAVLWNVVNIYMASNQKTVTIKHWRVHMLLTCPQFFNNLCISLLL